MAAGPVPTDLRVDHQTDPGNLSPDANPRFSWRLDTDRRGANQTAYRVRVARSSDALDHGVGDVWDSGRVTSGDSANVAYDGPPLASDETYHWTVRLWDDAGEATEWAEPGTFTTALGADHEFRGEWIAHQPSPGDSNGFRSAWRDPAAEWDPDWVKVDLGAVHDIAAVELYPASPFDGVETPDGMTVSALFSEAADEGHPITARGPDGFGFPVRYRVEAANDPDFSDAWVLVDNTEEIQSNPGTDPVEFDVDAEARYVRVTATKRYEVGPASGGPSYHSMKVGMMREEHRSWETFALAALAVRDADGDDVAIGGKVAASASVEQGGWSRDRLVDGVYESSVASSAPLMRTEVDLSKPVVRARLHVAALGWGVTYINGEKVGDDVLNPAWTKYDERILYSSYDVTDHLVEGANALGLWLGRGWFSKNDYDWTGFGSPRARAYLVVEYEDGTTREVATDANWRALESPIVENDIYDGETYDARREQPGWAEPGFDATDWDDVAAVGGPDGDLRPQRVQPVREIRTVDPDRIDERERGYVVDFGQNLTGWVELVIEGADAGDEIEIRHAETLTDTGGLATVDLRSADATDRYVARGDDLEVYAPRFTYHGFRYAKVEGYPGNLDPDDVTATVVHTDVEKRGSFACGNDDLNDVQHASEWSLKGNTVAVPTGCAQRDERTGWTGDAYLSARALLYNFDAGRFHAKWMRDHDDEQSRHGYVGDTVPFVHGTRPGDPSWTITRVAIPWYHYQFYGDERVLREHYVGMRRHVEYWHSLSDDGYLAAEYGNYGDWLAFENTRDGAPIGEPVALFNTASHYRATRTLADAAAVLGLAADADRYRERAAEIRTAFNDWFFDDDRGAYDPNTQAAQAIPLSHGLVPEGRDDDVAAALAEKIRDDGERLMTGFLGTRALLNALADYGHVDLAYRLVSQPEQPGWVYMTRQGATTLWERWNSDEEVGSGMNSYNHHQFAYVSEWFYGALAGLEFENAGSPADQFSITPSVPSALDWAAGSVETPYGELASRWEYTDAGLRLDVTIPWNTSATVHMPTPTDATSVRTAGDRLWSAQDGTADSHPRGVKYVQRGDDTLEVAIGAGDYTFEVTVDR